MFVLYLLLTVFLVLLADVFIKRRKLPPGPFPIPILGSLPYLIWQTYKHGSIANTMQQLKKDNGNVFTVWFGPIATISIGDYELAQQAMVKQGNEFTNRWTPFVLRATNAANLGIVFSNGDNWLEQRRFALHTLRNFGLGRNIMEQKVMDEYHFRTDLLNEQLKTSNTIQAHRFFDITVGSVIHRLLVSQRYGKLDMLLVAPLPCIFPRLTPSKHCQSVKSHSVMVLPKYDVELISSAEDKTSPSYFGVDDQFSTSTASRSAGPTQV